MNEIYTRKSVRTFTSEPLEVEVRQHLKAEISYIISQEACIKFQFIENDPEPFSSFTSSYGMFKNARNYIACVVDISYPNALQKAGYYAQQLVLYATKLGLGTCFVSGTFNPQKIKSQMRVDWKLPFIILVGYDANEKGSLTSRILKKAIKKSFTAADVLTSNSIPFDAVESRYSKLATALKAVAYAPSAMNRHPARIRIIEDDNQELKVTALLEKESDANQIDLGIAMYNWIAEAGGEWDFGYPAEWLPE
jgi:nitroreductase